MMEFLKEQLDFIAFFHGLALIILVAVCFVLKKKVKIVLPWFWLELFGISGGVIEWLFLYAHGFAKSQFLAGEVGSSLFLTGGRIFVLVISIRAAFALYTAAGKPTLPAGRWLQAGSFALALHAAAGIIDVTAFFEHMDVPVRIIQGLLIICFTLTLWVYAQAHNRHEPDPDPKARQITIRTAVTLMIIVGLGWAATQYIGNITRDEIRQRGISAANAILTRFLQEIKEDERAVRTIAGTKWITNALVSKNAADIAEANYLLDRFIGVRGAEACLLLDMTGAVAAFAEKSGSNSSLKKNYSQFPFFQQALAGRPGFRFAKSFQEDDRDYYLSFPVRSGQGQVVGVLVLEKGIRYLEAEFKQKDVYFLVDAQELIFLSSHPELLYKNLRPAQKGALLAQAATDGAELAIAGNKYLVTRRAVGREGWSLVLFTSANKIKGLRLFAITVTLCLSIITIVFAMAAQRIRRSAYIAATARAEAQKKLERAERLASLGTLAAGLAHEINQPLNALKIIVDGMLYWHKKGKQLELPMVIEKMQTISSQADRIEETLRHFRSFVRNENSAEYVPCNLNNAVEGALQVLGSQLKAHAIQVNKSLAAFLPPVQGQNGRLEEVIINLLVNAMQALDALDKTHKEIICVTRTEIPYVILEISDNATGVSEEIKEKVFEPFFTTKQAGEGMGLGLSIVCAIVMSFDGQIFIETNEKGGATFKVQIPISPAK